MRGDDPIKTEPRLDAALATLLASGEPSKDETIVQQRLEIERLRKDKALLIELVMDDTLKPISKNCVAIVIRDGGLAPTPLVTAWFEKVAARVSQQSTREEK